VRRHVGGPAAMAIAALLLAGCAAPPSPDVESEPFEMRDFLKTDADEIAELHLNETLAYLRALMVKLYKRNPREWRRSGKPSAEFAVERVFRGNRVPDFAELEGTRGTDSIQLAFDETYHGDRVLAFVAGLTSMVYAAYNDKREFFILDQLDPQKLYNSARNVEIAAWKLDHDRDSDGELFLLSNSVEGEDRNLSFERLFGKIIALQDAMAKLIAYKQNRSIRAIVHRGVRESLPDVPVSSLVRRHGIADLRQR